MVTGVFWSWIEIPVYCVPGINVGLQSSMLQRQTNKLLDKVIKLVVTRGVGQGEGELVENDQRMQIFSYKINKHKG